VLTFSSFDLEYVSGPFYKERKQARKKEREKEIFSCPFSEFSSLA
jgi:hypothetical protein